MGELSVGVKIWGDIANLVKSLNKGKEEVKGFTKNTDASFKDLIKSVRVAEDQFKKFAVQLGTNSKEAQAALANYRKLRGELDNINGALRPKKETSSIGQQIAGVAAGYASLAAVGGAVASFFAGAVKGAMEDERANKRLLASLDGNQAAFSRLDTWKNDMMGKTLFTEDEIRGAITMGTELGKTEAQTKQMVETAMGLSQVTGQDLNTAMLQLSQALDGNVGRLSKFIPGWKEMTEEQRKSVDVIGVLNERFGKLAGVGLNTTEGQVIQAKKAFEELSDSVGNNVIPVLGKLATIMSAKLLGSQNAEIKLLKDQIAVEQMLSKQGAGIRTKGEKSSRLIQLEEELRALTYQKNMEEMRAKAAAWSPEVKQQSNPMLTRLKTQIELEEKAAEVAKKGAADALKAWGAYLNFRASGGIGPVATFAQMGQGNEAINKMTPSTGLTTVSGSVNTTPQTGSALGSSNVKTTLSDWIEAINEVSEKARGLQTVWQDVFRSISTLVAKATTGFKEGWKDAMNTVGSVIQSGIGVISELFGQSNEKRLQQLDEYYTAEREKIEGSKMNDKAKAKAIEKLEEETASKRKVLMREQAKQQKTASLMQAVVAGALAVVQAFASGPGIGVVLGLLMTGLVAAQIATIASQPLPALAQGGLAMAPTLALVGDNPNARIDPEVISPLSKLKEMFNFGQGEQSLSVRLSGDDLLFVMERAQRSKLRRY